MKKLSQPSLFIILVLIFSVFAGTISVQARRVRDTVPPSAPLNLTAGLITTSTVALSWAPSTDNVAVSSYYIYKSGAYIAAATSCLYTVTGLLPNNEYSFSVKARDAAGNLSALSSGITVKTLSVTAPTLAPTIVPTTAPIPTITQAPTIAPTLSPIPTSVPNAKQVIGYYAGWSAYSGFTPDKINAASLTHINYAFANIGTDLKIALGDPQNDISNFTGLNNLKAIYPNLKTLISVGGWDWSARFSDAALTDASRLAFADSCVQFIKTYGFDGIDLDWEYPVSGGLSTNVYRAADKQNFTLLLKAIRQGLDVQGSLDGKHYFLSIAGAAGTGYCNNVEMGLISQYLDYAIVMTYDIHGTWDKYTDFNAPLYNPTEASPQYKWSVDSSVKAWIAAGFPANKLIIGVPFYGYQYNSVTGLNNGLYQAYASGASITYDNIVSKYINNSAFTRYYNNTAQVPWLWNGSTFISYDDSQSIVAKAAYVKNNSLAGASAWHLGGDTGGVLLNALYNGLK